MVSTFFPSLFLVTVVLCWLFSFYKCPSSFNNHNVRRSKNKKRNKINTKYFSIFCQAIKLQPCFTSFTTTKNNTIYTIPENRFLSNKNEIKYKCTCCVLLFIFSHSRCHKCEKSSLLLSFGNTVSPFYI